MLVSIIMPACDAQDTIARAVRSLLAQDFPDWEAVIVVDDLFDYAALLRDTGIADRRLRFVSTGRRRSGCHRARNLGLAAARGEVVGMLDADDEFHPRRLSLPAPVAAELGAAADNLVVVADQDGSPMYPVMGSLAAPATVGIEALLRLTAPLVPLIRRDHAEPRTEGVEYAEDVVANLRLVDRLGALTVLPAPYYVYRIRAGSIANDDRAGDEFEQAYSDYIARLAEGDGFGIAQANRAVAQVGFVHKRELNRDFRAAFRHDRTLNFQSYIWRAGRMAHPR